jgi:hypothetical protein
MKAGQDAEPEHFISQSALPLEGIKSKFQNALGISCNEHTGT